MKKKIVKNHRNFFNILYRIFRLDSTSIQNFAGAVLQAFEFFIFKKFRAIFKKLQFYTKNGKFVQFTPKCGKYNVVFLVKKIKGIDGVVCEICRI